MEWTQILVALVGGGLGGTILGRVWDNAREDRFRHVDKQVDAATEFMAAYEMLRHPKMMTGRDPAADAIGRFALADNRIRLLFGDDVGESADALGADLNASLDAHFNGAPEPTSTGLLARFNAAVRKELGVERSRRWYHPARRTTPAA